MEQRIARAVVRLPREPGALSVLRLARERSRVLRWLAGPGKGRPRSVSEIRDHLALHALSVSRLTELLDAMVGIGELDARETVATGNLRDRRPFLGYALPGSEGGAA